MLPAAAPHRRVRPWRARSLCCAWATLFQLSPVCDVRLMPGNLPGEITQLLGQWSGGDRAALDELMPLVYEELRRMAHRHMAHERPGHTLQATELVDEVYLKIKDERAARWQNRTHFFAVAAQMMRFILVDYARRHARARRGAGAQKVTLEDAMLVSGRQGQRTAVTGRGPAKARAIRQPQEPDRRHDVSATRPDGGGDGRSSRHFARNGDARLATGACLVAK